jgi:hypothetical protein
MYALPQSELLEKDPALPKKGIRAKGGFNVTFVTVEIRATPGRPSFARGAISRLAQASPSANSRDNISAHFRGN